MENILSMSEDEYKKWSLRFDHLCKSHINANRKVKILDSCIKPHCVRIERELTLEHTEEVVEQSANGKPLTFTIMHQKAPNIVCFRCDTIPENMQCPKCREYCQRERKTNINLFDLSCIIDEHQYLHIREVMNQPNCMARQALCQTTFSHLYPIKDAQQMWKPRLDRFYKNGKDYWFDPHTPKSTKK